MGRLLVWIGIASALLLAGCAPGPNPLIHEAAASGQTAGFLLGLWHGAIVGFTFLWSLFNPNVSIYEVHNNGWPYNLGFLLGSGGLLGGGLRVLVSGESERR